MSGIGVTVFGVIAVTFMMATYAAEKRHRAFVLAFAVGCLLSSAYGFLAGAWPFGVVEIIWAVSHCVDSKLEPGPRAPPSPRGFRGGQSQRPDRRCWEAESPRHSRAC